MEGHLAEGVACCVKHFPGHGDTHTDSHLDLPVVDKPQAELRDYELAPFKALSAHAPALMSAHIRFPALDAEWPATLSPAILTGLLRRELGFRGVAITDALNMRAIRERWGQPAGAVQTLKAGRTWRWCCNSPTRWKPVSTRCAPPCETANWRRRGWKRPPRGWTR
ncbi:beta-hexosaminidase [Chromobacterium violaceum]|uniref:Beta-hexosaminidase n=1 Tax=Chromobacterium violaceum TaxID=536 RepID=A0A3S4HI19_CHRVL|nr:beta-hexosaminidase [Chromobacterium violaceum]